MRSWFVELQPNGVVDAVEHVVAARCGDVQVETSPAGAGTSFTISLPRAVDAT